MILSYRLSSDKKRRKAAQLIDSVYYLSEDITHVRMNGDELEVEYEGRDGDVLQARLDRYMTVSLQSRYSPKTVLHDNRTGSMKNEGAAAASSLPVGGLRLEGGIVLLEEAFDRMFRELAQRHGASLRRYPSVLSGEQMKNSGYLLHFPQNIYGICEIPHDHEQLQRHRDQVAETQTTSPFFQQNGLFLQPCVCFHVYEELAQAGRAVGGLELFTAAGRCYRHEHRSRLTEVRLREFYMREIVYIGDADRVAAMRDRLLEEAWALFEQLQLTGYVESATDPFYFEDDSMLMFYQSSSELKYELRFAGPAQKDFSIASFNLCGHVLCEAFGMDRSAGEVYSGCAGFGIDRWIQAFLAVHGANPERWPAKMNAYLIGPQV
jgi:seryl-tRNA synthetase